VSCSVWRGKTFARLRAAKYLVLLSALYTVGAQAQSQPVVIASKPFGESFLLAEIFAQTLEEHGISVVRRPGLGATEVAFTALRNNAVDVYPEYVGTGLIAILHDTVIKDSRAAFARVNQRFTTKYGARWLPPLGFENTYAIAVRPQTAEQLHIRTLSDLAGASAKLRAGFTSDFIGRPDGLVGLSKTYGLRFKNVKPLAPALKYQALADSGVDVIDGYSTDGLLARYKLVTLTDDQHFFPPYDAAALVSPRIARERPDVIAALVTLSGQLDVAHMREWNRRIEVDREDVAKVAREAVRYVSGDDERMSLRTGLHHEADEMASRVLKLTGQHLLLVALALLMAALIGIPLGLALEGHPHASEITLGTFAAIETVPSIALLAFMIPLFGIGTLPALVALMLYAIYPIMRATYSGVRNADPDAVQSAAALGATKVQQLRWVRLPLAAPVIMSGLRTAAVITVGAATLAAFIGAGGLGEPIVEGLALADTTLILSGAIPAALLALTVDAALALVERAVRPAHQRNRREREPLLK
jgi:osmoprotectant transport system permease protein